MNEKSIYIGTFILILSFINSVFGFNSRHVEKIVNKYPPVEIEKKLNKYHNLRIVGSFLTGAGVISVIPGIILWKPANNDNWYVGTEGTEVAYVDKNNLFATALIVTGVLEIGGGVFLWIFNGKKEALFKEALKRVNVSYNQNFKMPSIKYSFSF